MRSYFFITPFKFQILLAIMILKILIPYSKPFFKFDDNTFDKICLNVTLGMRKACQYSTRTSEVL